MNPTIVLAIILVVLASFLFIHALYDLIFKRRQEFFSGTKLMWVFAILLFPILGPIVYFQVAKRRY